MKRRMLRLCTLTVLILGTGACAPERMSPGDRAAKNAAEEHQRARENAAIDRRSRELDLTGATTRD